MCKVKKKGNKMYCIIDTETTGLSPVRNALITVALVLKKDLFDTNTVEIQEFHMNANGYEIDDRALEVNGYTREEISSWPDRLETRIQILKFLDKQKKMTPVYHNAKFDIGFLGQILDDRIYREHFYHHDHDTMVVANFLNKARPGFSEGCSLSALRDKYGIEQSGSHRAAKDALDTAKVARLMLEELRS